MRRLTALNITTMALFGSALGAKKLPAYTHLFLFDAILSDNYLVEVPRGTSVGLGLVR